MIKKIILAVLLASSLSAQTSFAILPIQVTGVPDNTKQAVENSFYTNLIQSGKYKIIERSKIQDVIKEQNFQLSDLVDESKAAKFGKLLGVEKLISFNAYMKSAEVAITMKVVDISTAQIEVSVEKQGNLGTDVARWLAGEILFRYPLVGKVLGVAGASIVTTVGSLQGLKLGNRLYVARKEEMKNSKGEILFSEEKRIGILEITKLDASRSIAKTLKLADPGFVIMEDDIVSPDPIPKQPATAYNVPFWPDYKPGKLILDDDMKKNLYLSVTYGSGENYKSGKLSIDAREEKTAYAHCFYPQNFAVENFIAEGEVEFQEISGRYNKFNFVFLSNSKYLDNNAYMLYWNSEGGFEIDIYRNGSSQQLVDFQTTALLNRGAKTNKFKIVAANGKMDFYFNDKFLVAVENEIYYYGTFGFQSASECHAMVDNFKVWEFNP